MLQLALIVSCSSKTQWGLPLFWIFSLPKKHLPLCLPLCHVKNNKIRTLPSFKEHLIFWDRIFHWTWSLLFTLLIGIIEMSSRTNSLQWDMTDTCSRCHPNSLSLMIHIRVLSTCVRAVAPISVISAGKLPISSNPHGGYKPAFYMGDLNSGLHACRSRIFYWAIFLPLLHHL